MFSSVNCIIRMELCSPSTEEEEEGEARWRPQGCGTFYPDVFGSHQDVLESAAVVDCRVVVAAGPSQVVVGVRLVQTKRLCTQSKAVSPLFAPGITVR